MRWRRTASGCIAVGSHSARANCRPIVAIGYCATVIGSTDRRPADQRAQPSAVAKPSAANRHFSAAAQPSAFGHYSVAVTNGCFAANITAAGTNCT